MKLRKFIEERSASIASYVMIMFGMSVMLYMFGYTNMWVQYTTQASVTGNGSSIPITDPFMNIGFTFLSLILDSLYATLIAGVGVVGVVVFIYLFRNNPAIWQFIIPVAILIFLNIFVFPISAIQGDMNPIDALFQRTFEFSMTMILVAFFNLFYILAVMEYIRGGATP